MGSRDDLVAFFRSYSFQDDEAWLRIRRGMPSVTSDQALDRMKAIYIRDNMAPDFNPDWIATAAAAAAVAAGPSPSSANISYHDASPWTVQKRASLALRLPHGTVITTSFTDGQPLTGWRPSHAVREMWQNLRDGVSSQFPGVIIPSRSPTVASRYVVMSAGVRRIVAHVDATHPSVLRLVQQEVILLPKHLQLASYKDRRSAGCHGEGFKLGINLLLREGFTVTYAMPGQVWTFFMSSVYDAQLRNMSIRLDHGPDREDMEVCISGPRASELFEPNMDWELTEALLGRGCEMYRSSKGTVALASDVAAYGRVYSRNLFVDSDRTMEVLQLALNVERQQPRDRHVLQSGLVEELAGILLACLSESGDGPDSTPLFLHLLDRLREGKTDPRVRQAAGALREGLRAFHARQLHIRSDTIIYMDEAGDSRTLDILQQLGKHVIDNTGALGDTIDLHQLTMALIKKCAPYLPTDPDEARNRKALEEYARGLSLNSGHGNWRVTLEVRHTNVTGFCRCENDGTMYMTCDMLRSSRFKAAVTDMHVNVMRYVRGDTMALSDMLTSFLQDPFGFRATKLAPGAHAHPPPPPPPLPANGGASGGNGGGASVGGGPSNGSGGGGGGGSSSRTPSVPAPLPPPALNLPARFDAMQLHGEGVSSAVRRCDFDGIPAKFAPFPNEARLTDHAACYGPEGLELTAVRVGRELLHVDKRMIGEQRYRQLVSGAEGKVAELAGVVRSLVTNVAEALGMQVSEIPVVLVVCDDVLGFTQSGGVYLNLGPVLREPSLAKARTSLFMTLMHELTHRTRKPHDTHFASELARLVYACRHVLEYC